MRRLVILCLTSLACCSDNDVEKREIEALKVQIAELKAAQSVSLETPWEHDPVVAAAPELEPRYELVVTYPSGGAAAFRKEFKSEQACKSAKADVVRDYTERQAARQARVGNVTEDGVRIVAVGELERPSVVCLQN